VTEKRDPSLALRVTEKGGPFVAPSLRSGLRLRATKRGPSLALRATWWGGHPEGRKARRISEGPLRACALRASAQGDKRKASGWQERGTLRGPFGLAPSGLRLRATKKRVTKRERPQGYVEKLIRLR